jgi:hypothetical protein
VRALVPEEVKEILIGKRPCARRRDLRRLSGREREAARHDRAAGLVVGAKDSVLGYRETAEVLAAAVPSARIAWVDGGHAIDLAHPVVLSFVDAVLVLKEEPSLA